MVESVAMSSSLKKPLILLREPLATGKRPLIRKDLPESVSVFLSDKITFQNKILPRSCSLKSLPIMTFYLPDKDFTLRSLKTLR